MYVILLSMPLLQPPKKKRRTANIEIFVTTTNDDAEIVPDGGHKALENIIDLKIGQPVVDGLDDDGYAAVIVRKTKKGVHIVYPGDYERGHELYKAYILKDDVRNRLRPIQQQCKLVGHQFYGQENCVATVSHVADKYFLTVYEDGSYKFETEKSLRKIAAQNRKNMSSTCFSKNLWTSE
jgi:hypothetical protein